MNKFGNVKYNPYLSSMKNTNKKEHPVYKGYWFDKDGNAFSTRQGGKMKSKKPVINKSSGGYYYMTVSQNGKVCSKSVHRMVAETWIPNPDNKETVDHINMNKLDNSVSNLQWATRKEQMQNLIKNGKFPDRSGESNGRSILTRKDVETIRYLRSNDYTYKQIHKHFPQVSISTLENVVKNNWR